MAVMTEKYIDSMAWGHGLATFDSSGEIIDTWYPEPKLGKAPEDDTQWFAPASIEGMAEKDSLREVETKPIRTEIDLTLAVTSVSDAYLRLHLLSHCLVTPNSINLEGLFANLPNVVFTNKGPVNQNVYSKKIAAFKKAGIFVVNIDKFPRMVDYVSPEKVRIGDGSRIRLGAHLAPGTVVMHEGFVNFNAGTLGTSMVEGRISQGVVVDDGSDIGGGASIMGTLSGGGKHKISVGKRSLLGANSGLGISLGDDCVLEAGLYLTAGTKLTLIAGDGQQEVKASELSGKNNLLFRRNSLTGAVEALPREGAGVTLNSLLH